VKEKGLKGKTKNGCGKMDGGRVEILIEFYTSSPSIRIVVFTFFVENVPHFTFLLPRKGHLAHSSNRMVARMGVAVGQPKPHRKQLTEPEPTPSPPAFCIAVVSSKPESLHVERHEQEKRASRASFRVFYKGTLRASTKDKERGFLFRKPAGSRTARKDRT
jgi:hypothetical protein